MAGDMTGRVVDKPPRKHDCAPGWRSEFTDGPPFGPGWYSVPPDSREFPKGTVWECDCGKTWVSRGAIAPNSPGFTHWRRQSRITGAVRTLWWRWRPAGRGTMRT